MNHEDSAWSGEKFGLPDRRPGPRCGACSHPDRDRLDALLVAGDRTYASLQSEFEIDDSVIHRHKANCVPARLMRNQQALSNESDARFRQLAITQSENRLRRIQARADKLEEVREARAAAADPAVPGDHTGILVKRRRSMRMGLHVWEEVVDAEIDSAMLCEDRMLERAAAVETGEWLAQTGKGSFGAGSVHGPLVVVLASGLQPLPGPEPGVARHRITDPRRRVTPSAAQVETPAGPALGMTDLDLEVGEDTLQLALSGTPRDEDTGLDVDVGEG